MRKVIEYTLVSIDGVFAGPQLPRFMDYRDDAYLRDGLGQLMACDAMLLGRTTYENFAAIWPGRTHPWAAHVTELLDGSTCAGEALGIEGTSRTTP
jgi:hypothetical protein